MHARTFSSFAVVLVLVGTVSAEAQQRGRGRGRPGDQAPIRFQEMDRNNDRMIQRAEWTGSPQSFRLHDWNRDNLLSGDEVRVGAERAGRTPSEVDDPSFLYQFDDWTPRGFVSLDHNGDGRLTLDEWHFERATFRRADHNDDGVISRSEFLAEDALDDDRGDQFAHLDLDADKRISRSEWHGTRQLFDSLDDNRDGFITRAEMMGNEAPPEAFASLDINRDGAITATEWHWSTGAFNQRDTNRDGKLTRNEFEGLRPPLDTRSNAYRAGYERGAAEARVQAREDRAGSHGYDAEGQRELETADSGYEPRLGAKADYQAGYRAGWMRGYPEGWRDAPRDAPPRR
jgi:hypothetical protein